MKIHFVILILLITLKLNAQQFEWKESKANLSTGVQNYIENELFSKEGIGWRVKENKVILFERKYSRNLNDSTIQSLYRISKCRKRRNCNKFYLQIIETENRVIYFALREQDKEDLEQEEITSEYLQLVENHFERFGIKSKPDIQHKYFNPIDLIIVGFGCSAGGTPMPKFFETVELIKEKNKKELLEWCYSLIPEIRCYGAIGLKGLKEAGIKFNDSELDILEKVSNEETPVYQCSGCSGWGIRFETVQMMYEFGVTMLEEVN